MTDKNAKAVALFDQFAELYQQKYMDVSVYADTFRVFCNALPQNATVIELACGPGNITRFLLDCRRDLDVYATDLAPNMIELAKNNNPEARVGTMDCRDIRKIGLQYDAVMCGFVLPYLSKNDALTLIADSSKILNPSGVLYLSTMEGAYSESGWTSGSTGDKIYMHYHEAAYLKSALSESGMDVILETRIHTSTAKSPVVDLILIGKKTE